MMLEKENSLLVVKTLIIRGSNIETMTDKNETCLDLVPENIDEEWNEKLERMLKKHKCVCQATLTFRYLPIKYRRSKRTMIFFLIAMILLLYTHLTLVIPRK